MIISRVLLNLHFLILMKFCIIKRQYSRGKPNHNSNINWRGNNLVDFFAKTVKFMPTHLMSHRRFFFVLNYQILINIYTLYLCEAHIT